VRAPSEIVGLKWENIDWANNRFLVLSPKTEHYEGKKDRVVPIFGELKPFLEEQFDLAVPGYEFVIVDHRCTNVNLRKMLLRIIERAGLVAWPKLYHNLRASRATELVRDHPAHVVAAFLGHSVRIAAEHYLQVTEDDYAKAAQNAAQHMHVMPRIDSQPQNTAHEKRLVLPSNASSRNTMQASQVGEGGLDEVGFVIVHVLLLCYRVINQMAFKSPSSFLIAALIAGLVIFSPLIFRFKFVLKQFEIDPINTFLNLCIYTGVYIGTLLVIWIIFKIRNA
jgi:hypothetical protein